ncbi:MAG: hypothetical protein GX852_00815, partial [Clostridiales bacterium]|nr:hypothetical protein [Clostridiales bacterium]
MQEKLHTLAVKLPDDFDITELFGNLDTNIKLVEHATSTSIILRENKLLIKGDDPEVAGRIIYRLIES